MSAQAFSSVGDSEFHFGFNLFVDFLLILLTLGFFSELQRLLLSLPVEQWNKFYIWLCHLFYPWIHVTKTGSGYCFSSRVRYDCEIQRVQTEHELQIVGWIDKMNLTWEQFSSYSCLDDDLINYITLQVLGLSSSSTHRR